MKRCLCVCVCATETTCEQVDFLYRVYVELGQAGKVLRGGVYCLALFVHLDEDRGES